MIKYIASLFFSCTLLSAQTGYAEEVYKHVDEKGVPSFSDTKSKNAEKIVVEPINVQKMPELREIPPPLRSNNPAAGSQRYSKLEISSPADQSTIRNEPTITLSASLEPGLRADHHIEFVDNGQALQPASKKTSLVLADFERGEHNLSVRVIDSNGNTVQSSSPVTVYVFRAVAKPQAPPPPPAKPAAP